MAQRGVWRAVLLIRLVLIVLLAGSAGTAIAQSDDFTDVEKEVNKLFLAGRYAEAFSKQRTLVSNIDKAETAATGKPGVKTANALGNLAEYALYVRNFSEALAAAERARALAPELLWININRAHALLFLGRIEEARALYLAHRSKKIPENGKFWEDVVEEDFNALRAAGIENSAFEEIFAALGLPAESREELAVYRRLYYESISTKTLPLADKYVAATSKRYGEEHPAYATAIENLAVLYWTQGRYAEAEPLLKRALDIGEKALGPEHPSVATTLDNLAALYMTQGRYAEAEPLLKRSMEIREKALSPGHADVAASLISLAQLHRVRGHYAEAEPLYKRSLAILEKALWLDHPDIGAALNSLAGLYRDQGRYAEAEPLVKRALAIAEKTLGLDHPQVGSALDNLAVLYRDQGHYAEAEPLYKRSLAIIEKALGPDHPDVGFALNSLAGLYRDQGRYAEAEPLYNRSLAITEKALGPDNPWVAAVFHNLAHLYRAQGRYAEAEPLSKRSLAIFEKALGPDQPWVAAPLHNLAQLYRAQGRYAEADPLYKRSLAIIEKALGPDHPNVGAELNNLAGLYFEQSNWAAAVDYGRLSTSVILRRGERGTADVGHPVTGKRRGEVDQYSEHFWRLVKAAHRLVALDGHMDGTLAREMFQTAQWAQGSEAAASLAQMATRGARGDMKLALLVRERQDLVEEWQKRDAVLTKAASQLSDKRQAPDGSTFPCGMSSAWCGPSWGAEMDNARRLAAIDARIAEIDERLVAESQTMQR